MDDPKKHAISIEHLGLSARPLNQLRYAGIKTLEDLINCESERLLRIKNFGMQSLMEIVLSGERAGISQKVIRRWIGLVSKSKSDILRNARDGGIKKSWQLVTPAALEALEKAQNPETAWIIALRRHLAIKGQLHKVRKRIADRKRQINKRKHAIERRSRKKTQRLLEAFVEYSRAGTLQGAANQLGISRERVRQMLCEGMRKGLFIYPRGR